VGNIISVLAAGSQVGLMCRSSGTGSVPLALSAFPQGTGISGIPVAVARLDVLVVRSDRQPDAACERATPEL
jgi:hypothetical protein